MPKFLILALILCSCGPSYHLRRAEYHKRLAIAKGAEIKADTVWTEKVVTLPGDTTTIVLRGSNSVRDTTIYQDRIKVTIRRDTLKEYIHVECPPDTVKIRVPYAVNQVIKAPPTFLDKWWWAIAILVALAFLYAIKRK